MTVQGDSSDDRRRDFCPRLIDYLVICGIRHPGQRRTGSSSSDYYPNFSMEVSEKASAAPTSGPPMHMVENPDLLRRYPSEDHVDFRLPSDVVFFCQPEGCISVESKRQTFRDASSFVFTLTEKDSAKIRYGICVNFYRTYERRNFKERMHCQSTHSPENSPPPRSGKIKRFYTLTSLCIISHHPFFTTFRQTLNILRKLIDVCKTRACVSKFTSGPATSANSRHKLDRDLVWATITGQLKENVPLVVMHEIKELETWILRLLSALVPVPGKTKVEVVMKSRDFNAVSMCVLAFVSLLYPLEYLFPVIPLLPDYLAGAEHLFLAPTPFVIGVPASFFNHKKMERMPADIVIVDLDSDRVSLPQGMPFPEIPEPESNMLKNHFQQALTTVSAHGLDDIQGIPGAKCSIGNVNFNDTDAVDIATRVAMVIGFESARIRFGGVEKYTGLMHALKSLLIKEGFSGGVYFRHEFIY